MGIDRIGSKGPPATPPTNEAGGAGRSGETGRRFEPPTVGAPSQVGPVPAPATALERLRSGEIDLDGYLDQKTSEATAHLTALPPEQLDAIRSALRDRMAGDPTLVDLVRIATGRVPSPPQDD